MVVAIAAGGVFAGAQLVIIHNFLGGGPERGAKLCGTAIIQPLLAGKVIVTAQLRAAAEVEEC